MMEEDIPTRQRRQKRRKVARITPVRMQRDLAECGQHAAIDDRGNKVTIRGMKTNQIYVLLRKS